MRFLEHEKRFRQLASLLIGLGVLLNLMGTVTDNRWATLLAGPVLGTTLIALPPFYHGLNCLIGLRTASLLFRLAGFGAWWLALDYLSLL